MKLLIIRGLAKFYLDEDSIIVKALLKYYLNSKVFSAKLEVV